MSDKQDAKQKSRNGLSDARKYRRQGQTLKALKACDQALEDYQQSTSGGGRRDAKLLAALHAQRGAAKADLGFLTSRRLDDPEQQPADDDMPGAIEDLESAVALDKDNGWAWARLGDAYRVLARDNYKLVSPAQFDAWKQRALEAFEHAARLLPEEGAWLKAHMGATHFSACWTALEEEAEQNQRPRKGKGKPARRTRNGKNQDKETARALFQAAIEENPSYAWAKRFLAYVATLDQDYDLSKEILGDALLDDPQARLQVLRGVGLLSLYAGSQEQPRAAGGKARSKADRAVALDDAMRASSQALLQDHEDYMALYVQAATVSELARAHGADPKYAEEVCRNACGKLLNVVGRIMALAVGLYLRSGKHASIESAQLAVLELLDKHLESTHRDHELQVIGVHEPFWASPAPGGVYDPREGQSHLGATRDILHKLTEIAREARAQLASKGKQ